MLLFIQLGSITAAYLLYICPQNSSNCPTGTHDKTEAGESDCDLFVLCVTASELIKIKTQIAVKSEK